MAQVTKKPRQGGSPTSVSYYYHDQTLSSPPSRNNNKKYLSTGHLPVGKPHKLSSEKRRYVIDSSNDSGISNEDFEEDDGMNSLNRFEGWQEKLHLKQQQQQQQRDSKHEQPLSPPFTSSSRKASKKLNSKKSPITNNEKPTSPNNRNVANFYRKLPNSIALPVRPKRHEDFERRLTTDRVGGVSAREENRSNSHNDSKNKSFVNSKTTHSRNEYHQKDNNLSYGSEKSRDDKSVNMKESGNRATTSPTNQSSTHKGKVAYPKRNGSGNNSLNSSSSTSSTNNGNNDADPPTNVDETGKDAKLLAVRRIGSPPDGGRSSREDTLDRGGDSTSSSIQEGEAPDVFLPKRYAF